MGKDQQYSIPLESLLEVLRSNGYELSVQQVLEIQSILLASPLSKTRINHIKYIITPIIAKSDEDQQALYRLIDSYITNFLQDGPGNPKSIWQELFGNKRSLFRWKVAGIILTVTVGIAIYFNNTHKAESTASTPIVKQEKKDKTEQATNKKEDDAISTKKEAAGKPGHAIENQGPAISEIESHELIIPERINFNLQMSAAFGILFGIIVSYFIFYQKKAAIEKNKRKRETSMDPDGATREREGQYGNLEAAEQASRISLEFPGNDFLIQKPSALSTIKRNFKKPVFTEQAAIDIKKTIKQTTRQGGFPAIYFEDPWKERKFVIITDDKQSEAHVSKLLNYFVNSLTGAKIPVAWYSFTTDIRTLKDQASTISLENVLVGNIQKHLIIISNCSSFFDESSLVLKRDIRSLFSKWPSKSVITNTPVADWSSKEAQLQENGFLVVPAEIEGIEMLSEALVENTILKKERIEKRLRNNYSVNKHNFHSIEDLKAYLGNEHLFQIVCSLSVYPVLRWPITLALFSALVNDLEDLHAHVQVDYDTLLKISRIPWLYRDKLEEPTRLELLNNLRQDVEIKARETILSLLKEVEPLTPIDSPAYHEFEVQFNMNSFFLFSHDQEKYHQYDLSKRKMLQYWEHLPEWSLKEHVNQRKAGIMPTGKFGNRVTVDEFIIQESRFEQKDITISKLALLTVPAILLYILFSLFQPSFVYPTDLYKKISFNAIIHQDPNCNRPFTRIVADTSVYTLNRFKDKDTVFIKNLLYDSNIDLYFYTADSTEKKITINPTDKYISFDARCQ